MAETTTVELPELSSSELFQSAVNDTPVETVTDATPEPVNDVPRDEQGRFAPKVEVAEVAPVVTQPEPAQALAKTEEATVPSWRLREVREESERRIKEMEDRFAALQRQPARQEPPAPPPNVFDNPEGWQAHLQQQQAAAIAAQRYEFSEMLARQAFGDDKVNEAEKWAAANVGPAEKARIANARHPYAELIKLKDERATLAEIGTDPKAYVQKKLDEALNDPAFLARAIEKARGGTQSGVQPTNIVQLPPSINRATSAASPHDEAGDMSDRALFNYATK